jgi:hypothetical protein
MPPLFFAGAMPRRAKYNFAAAKKNPTPALPLSRGGRKAVASKVFPENANLPSGQVFVACMAACT